MITTGIVSSSRNCMKVSPAPDPIMMFGGSPISVAVPPMFAAMIVGRITRSGGAPTRWAAARTTGATKITVVTLSRKADAMAVNHHKRTIARTGRPPNRSRMRSTAQPKTPVSLSTPTKAIIAASKSSTLISSACAVASKVSRR